MDSSANLTYASLRGLDGLSASLANASDNPEKVGTIAAAI
jgi:hypothetical protein